MAAVIRYLSADNHAADSPPFNSLETGLQSAIVSLLRGAVFEMSIWSVSTVYTACLLVYVSECVCVCVLRYYR